MLNKNWTSITQASLTFYQMSRIIDNFSFDSLAPYQSIVDFSEPTSRIFPESSSDILWVIKSIRHFLKFISKTY